MRERIYVARACLRCGGGGVRVWYLRRRRVLRKPRRVGGVRAIPRRLLPVHYGCRTTLARYARYAVHAAVAITGARMRAKRRTAAKRDKWYDNAPGGPRAIANSTGQRCNDAWRNKSNDNNHKNKL